MESDILSARGCGVRPGFEYDETDGVALERVKGNMPGASGRTIYVLTGVGELAGATEEISTMANATGAFRVPGDENATIMQWFGSAFFALSDARNNCSSSREIPLEEPALRKELQQAA